MPFKDEDRRREYQLERARKRRDDANSKRRERYAEKRRAEREAVSAPDLPDLRSSMATCSA